MEKPKESIHEEVKQQLLPLFKNLHYGSPVLLAITKNRKELMRELDRFQPVAILFKEVIDKVTNLTQEKSNQKEHGKIFTLIAVFEYLSAIETIGNSVINLVLLFLVAEGHDIHLAPDRQHSYVRHAITLEDLDSPTLSLAIKLDILDSLGYTLFSKWINRKLRNAIAHLDFEIDEVGSFFIIDKKGRKCKFPLKEKIMENLEYSEEITKLIVEQLRGIKEKLH